MLASRFPDDPGGFADAAKRLAALEGRPCPHCRREGLLLAVMHWDGRDLICRDIATMRPGPHTWDNPATAEQEISPEARPCLL